MAVPYRGAGAPPRGLVPPEFLSFRVSSLPRSQVSRPVLPDRFIANLTVVAHMVDKVRLSVAVTVALPLLPTFLEAQQFE